MKLGIDKVLVISGLLSFIMIISVDIFIAPYYPNYDYYSDVISMLGAVDSPVALPTNITFFLFGAFMFLFGFGLYRNYAEDGYGRAGAVIFIAAGAMLSMIGVFQCDAQCIDVTLTAEMHQFFAEVPMIMTGVGLALLTIHEMRGKGFRGKGTNLFLYLFPLILVLAAFLTAVHIEFNLDRSLDGFYERLAIYVPMALMAFASVYIFRDRLMKKS
jgi:hypothetical membrane protein